MTTALTRRHFNIALAGALASAGTAHAADTWPGKPIRWVVAYPAGGGSDFLARQLAPQLGKQLGQTIIIDNRPGAAGMIGTDNAAKSPPDGYTIVTGDNGAMVFNSAMYKKVPYEPKDLAPIGFMARFPLILAVNPNAGFTSAQQLLDAIKKNPGKYSYASPGIGSPHHLAMELLKDRTGSFVVHVPYRGTALAVQDVISGQVPMMVLDTAAGLPQIKGGKVKALAVMSKKRIASLPEVPTLGELGIQGFEVTAWQGLFVPHGTPPEIVARLTQEMHKAITTPEVKARLEEFGLEVAPTDGPALAAFVQQETRFWHALIRERKLSAD
ncbi:MULTISPECIES: tripartite tricarboxylate transporter substrate binding protein [unclassified Rhizobacter]|uniref:Bug family tripartite tricarboxylate transporter substrate binding protein n=1 Tax=unclassified Rhizobacter TaxID=2640088 RepID=UPI0006F439E1|nr:MULTISPECIES: tripartite tricarboxylate transporter substrate binding protein [unclassified Rhizobacter]KQU73297.1 ABC transporter substrate-binding protein [Rhizobacter sp. Root29]KQV98291.1 ABC transporter substrate-binding protein [Rhizobacter sp. Root1238]KRB12566.1 ABC transporter substrate-binding protein [Rhizobacter sp. Root16D2]